MTISLPTLDGVESGVFKVVALKDNFYVTYIIDLNLSTSEIIDASVDFVHRMDHNVSMYKAIVGERLSYFASRNNIGFIRLGGRVVSIEVYSPVADFQI